jgi:hypothetical protein
MTRGPCFDSDSCDPPNPLQTLSKASLLALIARDPHRI